jgi:hypothetical protein
VGLFKILSRAGVLGLDGEIRYSAGPEMRALDPLDGCKICGSLNDELNPSSVKVKAEVVCKKFIFKNALFKLN